MIKKIYSLSFSIACAGFLWSVSTAHAMPSCETFCQSNTCRSSPDLASICFKDCPQAQACHIAAFDEFRRLHEIHNRPNRGQKPRKDRDGIKRERGTKSTEFQPNASLTSELPAVSLSNELPTNDESSVLTQTPTLNDPIVSTQTPELSLIPSPPPLPSDLPVVGKPSVGEEGIKKDFLSELRGQKERLKKIDEITDSKSTLQGKYEATTEKNDMLEALKKAMADRRKYVASADEETSSKNDIPLSSDDDWDE